MDGGAVDDADDRYGAMLARLEALSAEFADSRQFEALTPTQQEKAPAIVEFLGELLFGYEMVTIEECDAVDLETVCTRVYPAKISAGTDHFQAVAPVVSALFRFLGDRGYRPDGDALAERVEGLGDEILGASANPDNWGMAKSAVMGRPGAVQAGDTPPGDPSSPTGRSLPDFPVDGVTAEELATVDEAVESLSSDQRAALDAVTEQVVATAPTESGLRETFAEIMPDGAEDHPYVYHYDP